MLKSLEKDEVVSKTVQYAIGRIIPPWSTFKRLIVTLLRSSGLGVFIGMIPGAGADIAAFVSYNEAKRFASRKISLARVNSKRFRPVKQALMAARAARCCLC